MTGEEVSGPAGPKVLRLLYFVGAGVICTAAINKYRDYERKTLIQQQQQLKTKAVAVEAPTSPDSAVATHLRTADCFHVSCNLEIIGLRCILYPPETLLSWRAVHKTTVFAQCFASGKKKMGVDLCRCSLMQIQIRLRLSSSEQGEITYFSEPWNWKPIKWL
ncbi:hypothetical protein Ahy_B08g092305 isoform A [Arachis hypogaea]|uniref:Uncharacterized protein n=1 Tax=Arachis hypogaea TaxID=3818 RepID=A0A444Y3L9_ARAHY|nr:hypothetical protein Ahy_B08g092305 isoform A [Arachis hypogaea]